MTNEFDLKAREWDKNQVHIDRSEAISVALQNMVPLDKHMKALEFGAGTGLLSFMLYNKLGEITLMDTSTEMINVLKGKIAAQHAIRMKPVVLSLEEENYPEKFDLIFSQMVFHHVDKIGIVLSKFYDMLNPGGYVAIADIYPEDGSFHGDGFTGHKGFDPELFGNWMIGQGFKNIVHKPCYIFKKIINSGKEKSFPIFMLTARK